MLVVDIGSGEPSRNISGTYRIDPNFPAECDAMTFDCLLPFEDGDVDMFISRYAFRNVWNLHDNKEMGNTRLERLHLSLTELERCLAWTGMITIIDYAEQMLGEDQQVYDGSPLTDMETFKLAVGKIDNLEIETMSYDQENGQYTIIIVKEPRTEEDTKHSAPDLPDSILSVPLLDREVPYGNVYSYHTKDKESQTEWFSLNVILRKEYDYEIDRHNTNIDIVITKKEGDTNE